MVDRRTVIKGAVVATAAAALGTKARKDVEKGTKNTSKNK